MTFGSRMQIINLYGRSFCGRPSSFDGGANPQAGVATEGQPAQVDTPLTRR